MHGSHAENKMMSCIGWRPLISVQSCSYNGIGFHLLHSAGQRMCCGEFYTLFTASDTHNAGVIESIVNARFYRWHWARTCGVVRKHSKWWTLRSVTCHWIVLKGWTYAVSCPCFFDMGKSQWSRLIYDINSKNNFFSPAMTNVLSTQTLHLTEL
jgi:hypothetical protein